MSTITKQQFLEDVEHEVKMLKKHMTKEELGNLDFSNFNPRKSCDCLYGQATGHCSTIRATELISICCKKVFDTTKNLKGGIAVTEDKTFLDFKHYINGAFVHDEMTDEDGERDISYISLLEGYITMKGAKNKMIFDYLQGKSKDLKL